MYTNHFHELIDASKKLKVFPDKNLPDVQHGIAKEIVGSLWSASDGVVCFVADFDAVPVVGLQPEIFRLPFPKCWFEFNVDGGIYGLLCQEDKKEIVVNVFNKPKGIPWIFSCTAILSCSEKDKINTRFAGVYEQDQTTMILCVARYLMALNCCNIKRTEHKPEASKQSVRRALGRQPLFSTWTLGIDLQRTAREMPGQGGTHASPRLHLRRGHARQHKPGLWCWVQPHVVGDKSLGMIHKDYAIH